MYLGLTVLFFLLVHTTQGRYFARHYNPLVINYVYGQCDLQEANDSGVGGIIRLRQSVAEGYDHPLLSSLDVEVSVTGLDPNDSVKTKGFHVHSYGDTGNNCLSAGGHFNPDGVNHGAPNNGPGKRHIGDWGNLPIDDLNPATIRYKFSDYLAKLTGDNSIFGRAIVLHSGTDDLGTGTDAGSKANGNAGTRIACCIIRAVKGWD